MSKKNKNKIGNAMIKHPAKVFFLSVLAVIFTSSNGMNINNLVNEKNIAPESNSTGSSSEVSISHETITGWFLTQAYSEGESTENSEGESTEKYNATCPVENCSRQFEGEIKSSPSKVFIDHVINSHVKNASHVVIAQKLIRLKCKDTFFLMEIKHPTLLLCKDSNGVYFGYRCNNCNTDKARKKKVVELKIECKRHLYSCYKKEMNKLLEDNKTMRLKDCCLAAPDFKLHMWNCHIGFESNQE